MSGVGRPGSAPGRASPFYLIVRGPLGIGKSTVAAELARRLGGAVVAIDEILEHHDLERWEDGYISEESFRRANEFAADAGRRFLAARTSVVFDGNFYWRSQIDDLLARLPWPRDVFTLEAPVDVCLRRDRERARPLGAEGVYAVYAKATSFAYGAKIDASGSLEATVASILARLPPAARPLRGSG